MHYSDTPHEKSVKIKVLKNVIHINGKTCTNAIKAQPHLCVTLIDFLFSIGYWVWQHVTSLLGTTDGKQVSP